MKIPILKDLEKWQMLNPPGKFSKFDYIFQVMKANRCNSDLYFAFLEVFWPAFIEYNGYILLKEIFSEKKIDDLIKKGSPVEYWMNIFLIDSYFEEDESDVSKAESFAAALKEIWQIKLHKDFPSHEFIVESICDEESGDYGITFYQKQNR